MGAIKFMSLLTVCSVFAALISIVWQALVSLKQLNRITTILTVFLSIESSNKRLDPPKVAIGYGACSDLLISGTDFLNFTEAMLYDIGARLTSEEINSPKDLLRNFAYFFQNGAAAERFVTDGDLFRGLIEKAKKEHRDSLQWFLGGNAALMGLRFYLEGADVLLGAQMSKKLRRLVPDKIKVTGDPLEEDEIHVILEYKAGDQWGNLTAPRANRFIVHNDHNNPQLRVLEEFGEALKIFQPQLLVVTNLHVMDKYKFESGMREKRLLKVQQQLALQPAATLTHFEMASYVDIEMLKILCKDVLPYVDSLGMNEQELSNLDAIIRTGKTVPVTDWNPDIAITMDQMRLIFKHFVKNFNKHAGAKRLLSRIHVHTLAYQVLLTRTDSKWRNNKAAAAKASLIAHRYVCQTDMINPESANLLLPDKYYTSKTQKREAIHLDPKNPIACWREQVELIEESDSKIEVEICVSPVLVCRVAKKAAGAGDNISAAALLQQL